MQVNKQAREDGLNVYVAVVAAVKGSAAAAKCEAARASADAPGQKYADTTAILDVSHGYYALVMQHCSGSATKDVFLKPTWSKVVTAGATSAVKLMISNSSVGASLTSILPQGMSAAT